MDLSYQLVNNLYVYFQDLSNKQPARVKKAFSCDLGLVVSPVQSTDSQGYLSPMSQETSKPKYLELLGDLGPEPSTSHAQPSTSDHAAPKQRLASAPLLQSKFLRASPARALNYTQLESDSVESDADSDKQNTSGSARSTLDRPRPHSTGHNGHPDIRCSELATSNHPNSTNMDALPKVHASNLPINYAHIAPCLVSDSDTDNEAITMDSRESSHDPFMALDDDHSRSRSGSRSGSADPFMRSYCSDSGVPNDPVLILPDTHSQHQPQSHDGTYLGQGQGQGQADVRSKVTGDTDLSNMGLHIWEPGDLVPEKHPNNNNLFMPSIKRDNSPFLRDASPFSDKGSLRNSPFRFDGMDEKPGGHFIYDGFLAPHDVDYCRKVDRTSPINGLPLSRITSSSDSSF